MAILPQVTRAGREKPGLGPSSPGGGRSVALPASPGNSPLCSA